MCFERHRKSTQQGVSLLETVIALAIASYALIASYGAFSGGLSSLNQSVERSQMMLYAETLLADIETVGFVPGEAAGRHANTYSWMTRINRYTEDKIKDNENLFIELSEGALYRVEIIIENEHGDQVTLKTLRLETTRDGS